MKHLLQFAHKEIWHNHVFDYLLIVTAAILFVVGVKMFAGMVGIQIFFFIAFAGFYIAWGIYHHILTKTLRLRIFLEYVLIGFLIIFLALTLSNY